MKFAHEACKVQFTMHNKRNGTWQKSKERQELTIRCQITGSSERATATTEKKQGKSQRSKKKKKKKEPNQVEQVSTSKAS